MVHAPAREAPLVHLALGDSLSAGRGDLDPQGNRLGWARRLADELGRATGRPHACTALAADHAGVADVAAGQLPAVRALRPDLVTVTVGTNDLQRGFDADRFAADLDGLYAALVAEGATVLGMTVPAVVHLLPMPEPLRDLVRELVHQANTAIRRSAEAHGVLVLDAEHAPEVADPAFWQEDRMHPSAHGHRLIAAAAAALLLASGGAADRAPRSTTP